MVPEMKQDDNFKIGRENFGDGNMWSTVQEYKKRVKDLVLMSGFNEAVGKVSIANSCSLVMSCVEQRGWSCVEKGTRT